MNSLTAIRVKRTADDKLLVALPKATSLLSFRKKQTEIEWKPLFSPEAYSEEAAVQKQRRQLSKILLKLNLKKSMGGLTVLGANKLVKMFSGHDLLSRALEQQPGGRVGHTDGPVASFSSMLRKAGLADETPFNQNSDNIDLYGDMLTLFALHAAALGRYFGDPSATQWLPTFDSLRQASVPNSVAMATLRASQTATAMTAQNMVPILPLHEDVVIVLPFESKTQAEHAQGYRTYENRPCVPFEELTEKRQAEMYVGVNDSHSGQQRFCFPLVYKRDEIITDLRNREVVDHSVFSSGTWPAMRNALQNTTFTRNNVAEFEVSTTASQPS